MAERFPSRPDALAMVGLLLLAFAAVAMISHSFGITDVLVSTNCGAAPSRGYDHVEAYIAYLDCQRTVENRYWGLTSGLTGCAVGLGVRTWLRREAKREAQRDKQLDEEMTRIRVDTEGRPAR